MESHLIELSSQNLVVEWKKLSLRYQLLLTSFLRKKFYDAMKGLGTNDEALIRLVVTQKERNLRKANARYLQRYEQTLTSRIEDECSGDYKQLLVGIMKNWGN